MLWSTAFKYQLKKFGIVQKKCIRHVCKLTYNKSTTPYFKQQNILKLNDISQLQLGKLMYLYSIDHLPIPIKLMFVANNNVHGYNTRNDPHFTQN